MNKIYLFLVAVVLSACSTFPNSMFATNKHSLPELKKDQAGVIFLREKGKVAGPVVNIYLDESYLTSLPEGNYKVATVCSQYQRISTQFSGTPIEEKYERAQNWKLPAGEWTYLTVSLGEDNQPTFSALDKKIGEEWVKQNHKQTYTLSRQRSQNCNVITPLKPSMVEAQAFFQNGQYQFSSLSPKGREKIIQIGKSIAHKPEVNFIQIIGHSDPGGTEKANQLMSERRAQSIKQALIKAGVNKELINVEGLGSKQLKVSDCAQKHPKDTQARSQCNRPNRRVDIQIHGIIQ